MSDRPAERTPAELQDLSRQLMVDFVPMASFSKDPFVLVEGNAPRHWCYDLKRISNVH